MKFTYTAINRRNQIVKGELDAVSPEEALKSVKSLGYRPIEVKRASKSNSFFSLQAGGNKVKPDELAIFTRQLSAMITAGVPLLRSLTALGGKGKNKIQRTALDLVREIKGGTSLADALSSHPDVFNDIYINMVRAGEAAGILDDILNRLALQQEKTSSMRKKIKSAMAYPVVLIVITIGAFFGLMLFVIPEIGEILTNLSDGKGELPMITQIMLKISGFFTNFWFIVFPVLGGGFFAITRYIRTPRGKKKFDRILLKLPIVSTLISKITIEQFTRTFSALMGAGVSVVNALDITSKAISNTVYRQALASAIEDVKNGEQLSSVLAQQSNLWPEIVIQMMEVGEETGSTDTSLIKIADFYAEEVDLTINQLNSILEPVMIVIMGAMVGVIAISVMGPISSLSQNVGTD